MDKNDIIESPLKKYLEKREETLFAFSRRSGIGTSTLYPIFHGRTPSRKVAVRICRHAKELKINDFGYEK